MTPFSAPKSSEEWAQMDEFLSIQVVPTVMQATDVDIMNSLLSRGIQDYLMTHHPAPKQSVHKRKSQKKPQGHQRALKAVREEKKQVKKQLRTLRRKNDNPEEVRLLAHRFHQILKQYSKLNKEEKRKMHTKNMQQQRNECHKNFWRFSNRLFNDDNFSEIEPAFDVQTAENFFQTTYHPTAATFQRPPWMNTPQPPSTGLSTDNITSEELDHVLKKCRTSSTPSPVDQISYSVLKHCSSLRPALLRLYNLCWMSKCVPRQWKVGVIQLLGKSSAEKDPSSPANFRPIALTSCLGKIYTSILKLRWQAFMIDNGYLNTSIQKAFVDGIPGCTEHHLKLLSMIEDARRRGKSLSVCWLDIANAYGSVHHELIRFSLNHYHAPDHFIDIVTNLYTGLTGIVRTKSWTTEPFHLGIGVFQGDPLSVAIFNTVMNTLVDTLAEHRNLGYTFSQSNHTCNLLQYADDTCLTGDGPASCQALLTRTEEWLQWSKMKAKVPKCASLAIQASTGKSFDPSLKLHGDTIPYISNSTFRFLGAPVTTHNAMAEHKAALLEKLEDMLNKVDQTLLTRQQKLHLYSNGICPRLTWDMTITTLPISWIERNLETMATRYLKCWSGLAKSANTNRLYLPKSSGGLQLPSITTMYKKTRCGLAASHMTSWDSTIRLLSSRKTMNEVKSTRAVFKPHQEVVEVMKEDPGASRKQLIRKSKQRINDADSTQRLEESRKLPVQGDIARRFNDRTPSIWADAIWSLPEKVMKFSLNAVQDTLPHNANLNLWKKQPSPNCTLCSKRQTLKHVLNHCPVALKNRRYNHRHDAILELLYKFACSHSKPHLQITVDLPNETYCFPHDFTCTDSRPDLVIWSEDMSWIGIIELTVPFETGIEDAAERKSTKYGDIVKECSMVTRDAQLITIEVGSRGFIHLPSMVNFYSVLDKSTIKEQQELEVEIVKACLFQSYSIWAKRNWRDPKDNILE